MRSTANLPTFSAVAAGLADVTFFVTHENPSVVATVNLEKTPASWEHTSFDGPCPDTEEALGIPKNKYLILVSEKENVSLFYRIRGDDGRTATQSAFKSALTMLDRQHTIIEQQQLKINETEAVMSELAAKCEKERKKRKKLKQQLKEQGHTAIADVVEVVAITVLQKFGITIPTDAFEKHPAGDTAESGEYHDDND